MQSPRQQNVTLFFTHLDVLLLAAQRMFLPQPKVVEIYFHLFTPEDVGLEDDEERAA